jgi:hypothetical protein
VRPSLVIVLHELLQHRLQVSPTEDQDMVQALPSDGSHPELGERVRAWRSIGQMYHLHALASEDLVEDGGELGVTITKQVPCSEIAMGAASVGRPLPMDEFAMPAEKGLRAHEPGGPGWPWEDSAQSGEEEAIARLPARAAYLALENGELLTESEHLSSEPELGLAADQQEIEDEADKGIGWRRT